MSNLSAAADCLEPRHVVLGRSTQVRRLLPARGRRMIGAWCFLDHYGPDLIVPGAAGEDGGMWVPPHPHSGLQTVTWLFEGAGYHTDSVGSRQRIEPGQLNVMTAGPGICHAEVSPADAPETLHGAQLWVCLPGGVRDSTPAAFQHVAELPRAALSGGTATVFLGTWSGLTSPADVFSPLLGVEVVLNPGGQVELPLNRDFEHGLLAVDRELVAQHQPLPHQAKRYWAPGLPALTLSNPHAEPVRALLIGGAPFEEEIVMWWNFIGRSQEEIEMFRAEWNEGGFEGNPARYGHVPDFPGRRLLAPELPGVRLKARGRAG